MARVHGVVAASAAALLLATAAGLDLIARVSEAPGVVIALTADPGGTLAALPARADLRVVNAWAGGRVLQLHAASTRQAARPLRGAWLLALPEAGVTIAGCG